MSIRQFDAKNIEKEVLELVKKRRASKQWSQGYVAASLEMDTAQYNRIENGKAHASLKTFLHLLAILDIRPSELTSWPWPDLATEQKPNLDAEGLRKANSALRLRLAKIEQFLKGYFDKMDSPDGEKSKAFVLSLIRGEV